MCMFKLTDTPKEEHFQLIRWKVVREHDLCEHMDYEMTPGKVHFDTSDIVIQSDCYENYKSGFHFYVDEDVAEIWAYTFGGFKKIPILVDELTAWGDHSGFYCYIRGIGKPVHGGVARIIYPLTEPEYQYLTTDHKPIMVSQDGILVHEDELFPV